MDTEKALKNFGLNDKEIKIYLSLLQLGRATVMTIAKKAGIKRPTTYLVLESLMEKGIVSKIPRKNKTLFMAEEPEKLMGIAEKRKKEIEKIIPKLLGIYKARDDKPQVRMYEGRGGIEHVYREVLELKGEVWWFGNLNIIHDEFKDIFDECEKLLNTNKIKFRDFIGNSDWEKEYATTEQRANHEIRVSKLPVDIDFFISDNRIAILSLKDDIYAVVIEHKRTADSLRSLYELAWRNAGKFKVKK